MNKLITTLFIVLIGTNLNYAQVGIGTENPQAMLDVAGTVLVQGETTLQQPLKLEYIESATVTELTGDEILLISDLGDENIVKQVNLETLTEALEIPNSYDAPNPTVYAAKKTSSFSLLSIDLLVTGFRPINFQTANRTIGNPALFSNSSYSYTVPSSGVYHIEFDLKLGTGLQTSLLGGSPGIGIVRTRGTTSTLIDSKSFSGVNVVLVLSATISDTRLSSIYELQAGDRITFGTTNASVITLDLLSGSIGSFSIRKISGPTQ